MIKGIPAKEIITSDIGLALYLLANECDIIGIEYEIGKKHRSRFKMKLMGSNPDKFSREYYSKHAVNIEFKKYLPVLFEKLVSIRPEIVDVTYSNIRAYKSDKGFGY